MLGCRSRCPTLEAPPDQPNVTIQDSTFILENQSLPSIEEVQKRAKLAPSTRYGIVAFPELNLIVKFGPDVSIMEGQSLFTLRRLLQDAVPIPEVYGWRSAGGIVYIFMQLIQGVTLEERWGGLLDNERKDVCEQLRQVIRNLRSVKQDNANQFIGT